MPLTLGRGVFYHINIIKLYFRPQPIDKNIEIQHHFHLGKVYTIASKVFIIKQRKKTQMMLPVVY